MIDTDIDVNVSVVIVAMIVCHCFTAIGRVMADRNGIWPVKNPDQLCTEVLFRNM